MGSLDPEGVRLPSRTRQFLAIMLKNVLLQIRSKTICGIKISGVWSVLFDIGIPVFFIGIMCFARQLPDIDTQPMVYKEISLRDSDWEFPRLGAALLPSCRAMTTNSSPWRSCSSMPPIQHQYTRIQPLHYFIFLFPSSQLHACCVARSEACDSNACESTAKATA